MTEFSEIRKLSAIMFTDIVGYSAIILKNDRLAPELPQLHCDMIRSVLEQHLGTEIKTISDSFHNEFTSALDAVECAVVIQQDFNDYHASVLDDRKIQLKVGVHPGDAIHRQNDVFGDGVNVAARIEPIG